MRRCVDVEGSRPLLQRLGSRREDGRGGWRRRSRGAGTEATIKRVPELVPEEVAKKSGMKLEQPTPICSVDELATYDAIIFGTPTRFGNMCAQMRNFLDQTGGLWMKGALVGK